MSMVPHAFPARMGALALAALFAWSAIAGAAALPDVPNHVLDQTGTLDAGEVAALERKLAGFEQRGGAQVVVVIVKTTGSETIEQYAVALFEKNAFGRKGKDDGVLLLVAKDDRSARIEVGYGLEGTIPDIRANQVLDQHLVPAFRAGDFHGGIERTTDALMALARGDPAAAEAEPAVPAAAALVPQPARPVPPTATIDDLPTPDVYVHNPAHWLMTQDVQELTAKLQAFERRTGSRISVVLLANRHPPLSAYAQAMLAKHPLGRPGLNDFVVVLASGDSATAEIVVGEGLKPSIDAVARQRMVSEILVPKLSARKAYEALDAATDELIDRVEKPGLFSLRAAPRHEVPVAQPTSPWPSMPRLDEQSTVALVLSAALAAIIGMLVVNFGESLPRFVRAAIGGVLAGLALWALLRQGTLESKAEAIGAWAMAVGAVFAFFAKPHWLDIFSGNGGSSRRGGGGGGGRSSTSSSGRSRGGRSGGGGASKRW